MMESLKRNIGLKWVRLVPLLVVAAIPLSVALVLYNDNVSSQSKPYIIQGYSLAKARMAVESTGAKVTQVLTIIKAVAARLTIDQYDQLYHHRNVRRIYPDLDLMTSAKDRGYVEQGRQRDTFYPSQVRADQLHLEGITGDGITIAVVDSGLGYHHPLIENTRGDNRLLAIFDVSSSSLVELSGVDEEDGDDSWYSWTSVGSLLNSFQSSSESSSKSSKNSSKSSRS
ncbi:MAG TPA: hypothetical protein QF924_21385 [Pseudomonadales bacterium]|nr:hypothetical protein [Pseudomonadales bacterium]